MISPQFAPAHQKQAANVGLQWDAPNFSNLHAEAEAPRQITSEAPHPLYGGHRYSSSASLSHSQRSSPKLAHSYTSSYSEGYGGGPLSAGTSVSAVSSPGGALNPFEDEELLPPLARSRTSSFGSLASSIHSFNGDISSRSPASLLIQNLPRDLTRREACLMFACANEFLSCELNASAALGPDNIPVSTSIVAYFKNRPAAQTAASALERRTDIFNDISLFPSPRGPWPISVQIISNSASAATNAMMGAVPHVSGPGSVGNGTSKHRSQKSKFSFAGGDEYGTDNEISGPYGTSAISAPPSVASNSTSAFAHYDPPALQALAMSNHQAHQLHPLRQGPGSSASLHLTGSTNMSHSPGMPSQNVTGLHDHAHSQGSSMIFPPHQQQQQSQSQPQSQSQHQHQQLQPQQSQHQLQHLLQHQHQAQLSQNQGPHPHSIGSHHSSASLNASFNNFHLNDDVGPPPMSTGNHIDEPLQPHHSGGPGQSSGVPHRIMPVRRSSAPGRGSMSVPGGPSGDDPSKIVMTYTPTSSAKALSVLQNGGRVLPPANPADQNPPCNTLYVGNLPPDTNEEELKDLFSVRPGYKRLCFRTKANGPMCFVEFEDENYAGMALEELYGKGLSNSVKGGIRLSFSKNPLGVRANRPRAA